MNYRHAFHAGNHADVLKHLVLVYCLAHLRRKETPFAVLDTHAGVGLHDLESDEARRSPEWKDGIGRLYWDRADAAAPISHYLEAVAAFNAEGVLRFYPGSPALIAQALRSRDRLLACELHKEDAEALRHRFNRNANVHVHARDGWEALGALAPFAERRGLVLIDPPYEAPDEMEVAVRALKDALKRFGHGIYLWWRPLKDESALARADAELGASGLRADLWVDDPRRNTRLVGSSLLIINPPFGLEDALRQALPALAARLSAGAAGWRVNAK